MYDAFEKITGGAKPKKEIKEMVHSKSDNGKHIVTHRHHRPDHHRDETHVFDNVGQVADHMEKHAGMPNMGEAEPQGGAPAPMTSAPSPEAAPAGPMPAGM